MATIKMRLNGRSITSATQLKRELERNMKKHVEDRLKKAAVPGIRIKKTRDGYTCEGTPDQIERLRMRLR